LSQHGDESFETLRTISARTFEDFNPEEENAILIWLIEVARPRYGEMCERDLDSAIAFWQNKRQRQP
jgi:hypothetical protein